MEVEMDDISVDDQVKLVLESRKNANILVNLLEKLDSSEAQELEKVISCLQKVFKSFISRRLWHEKLEADLGPTTFDEKEEGTLGSSEGIEAVEGQGKSKNTTRDSIHPKADAEKIYANWVHEKYLHFVKNLIGLLNHERKNIQKKCLNSLMQLLEAEHEAMVKSPKFDPSQCYFPNTLFSRVVDGLLQCNPTTMKNQLKNFDVYLRHNDIQFYSLKNIHRILNSRGKTISQDANVRSNVCILLLRITSANSNLEEENGFIIADEDQLEKFSPDSKERKKLFSNTWLSLLRLQLPSENLKKILANLHSDVMPYMEDPKLLIDFLTDAYDLEGPIALLALNGLFLLIQKYNLDYPDFFKKLYNLIHADVFEAQHRDRFFCLTDLFLTSTALPSYMVAAFAKRLARISLRTSPDAIKIILAMIENLMKRHPSCRLLIHRKKKSDSSSSEKISDPYNFDEQDLAKCNAINSSLWELKTLEQHYDADIQEAVKVFQQPFGKEEKDISQFVNISYAELFEKEFVAYKKEDDVPLNFETPSSLFGESAYDIWSFE